MGISTKKYSEMQIFMGKEFINNVTKYSEQLQFSTINQ